MSIYLCEKAALTEPTLLELSFAFHVATATYLVGVATDDAPPTSPQGAAPSEHIPSKHTPEGAALAGLQALPEFLVENVQDFMIFLKRFKDTLFEVSQSLLRVEL